MPSTRTRFTLLRLTFALSIITYIDRVCSFDGGAGYPEELGSDTGRKWAGCSAPSPSLMRRSRFPAAGWATLSALGRCSRASSCGGPHLPWRRVWSGTMPPADCPISLRSGRGGRVSRRCREVWLAGSLSVNGPGAWIHVHGIAAWRFDYAAACRLHHRCCGMAAIVLDFRMLGNRLVRVLVEMVSR